MIVDAIDKEYGRVLREVEHGPVYPTVTVEEIRRHLLSRYDFSRPIELHEAVADVEKMLREWQVQVTHPRYFGLFNPSVTLASAVADTLVALYNSQLANWRTSPAANEMERHTLGWFAAKFGLPEETRASFTTGGTEANQSAVVVALTRAFPGYGKDGLRSLPGAPTIYLTEESHHGFNKIAHLCGLGRNALRIVTVDKDLKMDVGDLERRVQEDRKNGSLPFMVVGTAGTTAAGILDPLPEIGAFCQKAGLWFHADAAWGGAAILSQKLRCHLAGIEMADSITCDAHKWFSVPMGCGMFFCRYPQAVAEAFRADVTYVPGKQAGPVFDPLTNSIQWSRRFIGLKLFLSLAQQGEQGQAETIERQTQLGDLLRNELRESGWNVVNSTPFPLVCFTRRGIDTGKFLACMRERQVAWMSEAIVHGQSVVRACITSFRTTEEDVRDVIAEMNRIASEIANEDSVSEKAGVIHN